MNRNPWPYAIIATFILFGIGTASLVTLACSQKVDLVSANYYEQEILYQKQIDRMQRSDSPAVRPAITYDRAAGRIIISMSTIQNSGSISGHIQFYRPSAAGLDRAQPLALDSLGTQTLDARKLRSGLWKIRLSWTAGGREYFTEESLVIQ